MLTAKHINKTILMEQDISFAPRQKHQHISSTYSHELSWAFQQRQESRFSEPRPQLMSLYSLNITVKDVLMCYKEWMNNEGVVLRITSVQNTVLKQNKEML